MERVQWVIVAAIGLAGGCGNTVMVVSGTGSDSVTSGGSGAAGAGGAAPRAIEIDYKMRAQVSYDPDDLLVMVNHLDGALAESFRGSALPTKTSVVDGDFVTFAYVTTGTSASGAPAEEITSYRVTPGVNRIEEYVRLRGTPTCVVEKMLVTVHIPEVPSAYGATVWTDRGGHEVSFELPPATVPLEVARCGDVPSVGMLTAVEGGAFGAFVAFQWDTVPFVANASLELTPTFAEQPRAPLVLQVDMLGDATQSDAHAQWSSSYDEGEILSVTEHGFDVLYEGAAPFEYTANLVDLPTGYPVAWVVVGAPAKGNACRRGANLSRVGASPSPISFHATELADPSLDGDAWSLGSGLRGDAVRSRMTRGGTLWQLHDDPAGDAYPAVFPAFPSALPQDFTVPDGEISLLDINHLDLEERAGYAALVADATPLAAYTARYRTAYFQCDP